MKKTRRNFLRYSGQFVVGMGLLGVSACNGNAHEEATATTEDATVATEEPATTPSEMFFKISLAQWSLHQALFDGELDNLDFAAKTKNAFGIDAVEYVSQFFKDKASDGKYLAEMNKRAADNGVTQLLIMIDGEGDLGDLDDKKRNKAIENHHKWVDAAKTLGCHSIRVNAFGEGSPEDVGKAAVQGLGALSEYAKGTGINVIVENHGSYSSDGQWLTNVMKEVNMPNCGTLPDFGNFCIKRKGGERWGADCVEEYDRYKGVMEMMPYAKGVSAKSHDFNEAGDEIHTDFVKMLNIVKKAGYTGYIGIEYEGSELSEDDGILATRDLLLKVGKGMG